MFQLNELNQLVLQLKKTNLSFEGYFEALRLIALIVFFFLKFLLIPAAVILLVVGLNIFYKWLITRKLAPITKDLVVLFVNKQKKIGKNIDCYKIYADRSKLQVLVSKRAILYKICIAFTYVLLAFLFAPFLFVETGLKVFITAVYAVAFLMLCLFVWAEPAECIYPKSDFGTDVMKEYHSYWLPDFNSKEEAIAWIEKEKQEKPFISVKEE